MDADDPAYTDGEDHEPPVDTLMRASRGLEGDYLKRHGPTALRSGLKPMVPHLTEGCQGMSILLLLFVRATTCSLCECVKLWFRGMPSIYVLLVCILIHFFLRRFARPWSACVLLMRISCVCQPVVTLCTCHVFSSQRVCKSVFFVCTSMYVFFVSMPVCFLFAYVPICLSQLLCRFVFFCSRINLRSLCE